jgi:hypothetical protein
MYLVVSCFDFLPKWILIHVQSELNYYTTQRHIRMRLNESTIGAQLLYNPNVPWDCVIVWLKFVFLALS